MKRALKILVLSAIIAIASTTVQAQEPPHPGGNPSDPGSGAPGPVGGGAPVDSGLVMLIAFGALYGARKIAALRRSEQ
ncbi:MAG: hypothetical protein M0R21_08280 [Lentimicrobiaceae bacterium]|nr:hypothetical protein [Lentimicrobiaceae bacterium]